MDEQPLDLWAEKRAELADLLNKLSPAQALEILHIIVAQCERTADLGAMLAGTIEGMSQRPKRYF